MIEEHLGEYQFLIEPYQVDVNGRVTFFALGNFLLNCASLHADHRGFGLRDLLKNSKAWFLTRFRFDIYRMPTVYNKITVKTWIHDIGPVFTHRFFEVLDNKGNQIATASSSWAMINLKTRKPVNITEEISQEYVVNRPDVNVALPTKIEYSNGEAKIREYTVKYSDIDINVHVNSMKYLQWVGDQFHMDMYKDKFINEVELNYLDEVLFGDDLQIAKKQTGESRYQICISKPTQKVPSCLAEVSFQSY